MTTMYRRKRRNPSWLRLLARRIGHFRFFRSLNHGLRESWEMAGKTV